ncbi:MAG: flagellar biosynthetic protein FliR [bacterium]|nr:flagellar biosynthetic protein FliR [bacterium]
MMAYTFSLISFEYFVLILVRVASFVAVAPFFGMTGVPNRVKTGLSAFLALLLFSSMPRVAVTYSGMLEYGIIVLKESITGLVLGMSANVCTYIVGFAGHMIDLEIGLSMAQEYNPMTRTQESTTGNFYYYVVLLLLLASNLHHYVIRALADSFQLIPVNTQLFDWGRMVEHALTYVTDMLILGCRLMLPVFACMMTLNCILGIMAKVAPQMNMFAVGIQIKVLAGYIVLFVSISLLPRMAELIGSEIKTMMQLMIRGMYGTG